MGSRMTQMGFGCTREDLDVLIRGLGAPMAIGSPHGLLGFVRGSWGALNGLFSAYGLLGAPNGIWVPQCGVCVPP